MSYVYIFCQLFYITISSIKQLTKHQFNTVFFKLDPMNINNNNYNGINELKTQSKQ